MKVSKTQMFFGLSISSVVLDLTRAGGVTGHGRAIEQNSWPAVFVECFSAKAENIWNDSQEHIT